jgi:tight adherence protein C
MTPGALLIVFFLFTLAAVSAAGYVFVLRPARTNEGGAEIPAPLGRQSDLPTAQAAVLDMFRLIGDAMPGRLAQEARARKLLAAAGYRWPSAVSVFLGIKCGLALMLAATVAWVAVTFRPDSSIAFISAIGGLGFGFLLPDRVLERLAARRVERLRRALPAALDLMTHPELASEFTQFHLELRANPSRLEALQNFAGRGRDIELRKFVNLLMDTDRFGTSLGPALRNHARYLRTRFRQAAQERARKVSVKLIFPVFFLIFPSVILVTLGPAVMLFFAQMHTLLGQ